MTRRARELALGLLPGHMLAILVHGDLQQESEKRLTTKVSVRPITSSEELVSPHNPPMGDKRQLRTLASPRGSRIRDAYSRVSDPRAEETTSSPELQELQLAAHQLELLPPRPPRPRRTQEPGRSPA